MRTSRGWLVALSLLIPVGTWLAQRPEVYHKPDHGAALKRALAPVEITIKDAAGAPVVIDRHAVTNAHINQLIRLDGEYSWQVPSEFDQLRGVLTGGSPSAPGLEPGEYQVDLALGRYGAVSEKIRVGKEGLKKELRAPLSRKTIKLRFVDEAGNPVASIPNIPRFEEKEVYNTAFEDVLPTPVLRLPPRLTAPDVGKGGFSFRRARGGSSPVVLLKDGWCHATVFDGGAGVLSVSLSEKHFGIKVYEIKSPFEQEYTVKVTLSDAWRGLDLEERGVVNKDDPGLIETNKPAKPAEAGAQKPHSVKLKLPSTVQAWSRYARVIEDDYVHGLIRPTGIDFPVKVGPVEALYLSSMPTHWPLDWNYIDADDYSIKARTNRSDDRSPLLVADGKGTVPGVFARVLTSSGAPARFVEATVIALEDDKIAKAMLDLEVKLEAAGKRPPACDTLPVLTQQELREAEMEKDEAALKSAMDGETYASLERAEYRFRYARFGAWYDSHQRIDGDADGYLMAPHFTLEKDKGYVVYLWHTSRNDLKPDARIVIRGTGDTTDLGVIRLPK